jgi:hypothetical protein
LAAASGSRNVYTPGVFMQGRETRWSMRAAFDAQLAEINRKPAAARIVLDRIEARGQRIEFSAQAELLRPAPGDARLYVALIQNGLSTAVRAGENRGATLANDRVVRAWSGPLSLGAHRLGFDAPTRELAELALVAFVENSTGVLQALQLPLASCRAG